VKISEFRQTGLIELLILLVESELKISEIIDFIPQQSAYRSIAVLEKLDLITVKRGEYNKKYYSLTNKGQSFSSRLFFFLHNSIYSPHFSFLSQNGKNLSKNYHKKQSYLQPFLAPEIRNLIHPRRRKKREMLDTFVIENRKKFVSV